MAALASALPPEGCAGFMLTGGGAALVRERFPEAPVLEDVPALTRGAALLAPEARSIVCLGAQNAFFVTGFADGAPPRFAMNEGCAAGTGSFFEDQMGRLGLPLEEYSALVGRAQSVPRLSGRCSVFAKTDIIHRQQEGVAVEDILLGLCFAVVKSFKATIVAGFRWTLPCCSPAARLLTPGWCAPCARCSSWARASWWRARSACSRKPRARLRPHGTRPAPGRRAAVRCSTICARPWARPRRRATCRASTRFHPRRSIRGRASARCRARGPRTRTASPPAFWAWTWAPPPPTSCFWTKRAGCWTRSTCARAATPQQAVREGLASLRERLGAEVRVAAVGVTGSGPHRSSGS